MDSVYDDVNIIVWKYRLIRLETLPVSVDLSLEVPV